MGNFEYDDVIHHLLLAQRMLYEGCYSISIAQHFRRDGRSDSNTLRVEAYFFENGGNKSPFSKISGYVWTGPKLSGSYQCQSTIEFKQPLPYAATLLCSRSLLLLYHFSQKKMRKSSFKAYKKCINYFFAIFSDGKTRSLWKEHFFYLGMSGQKYVKKVLIDI